ncbi:MAG: YceI family protein [bacterium]|nr:YceI family protein [bacterium]
MFKIKIIFQMSLLVCLLVCSSSVMAARFDIAVGGESEIIFKSKAPLEKFDGKTKKLSGFFEADLSNLVGPVTLEVEIDLASFDTGKKKRNKHMRENHLETEKFPSSWFRAGSIKSSSKPSLVTGESVSIVLSGELDLHGVRKAHEVTLKLTRTDDGAVTIEGEFQVKLSDHDIKRPKFLVMKLADEQLVLVNLLARQGS